MVTDLVVQAILKLRNEVLDGILKNMRGWDNTIESGISLIESNQQSLSNLETLNSELIKLTETITYDEDYVHKLNLIMNELENLTYSLKGKQNILLDGKQQLNKKTQVMKAYISQNKESFFIDKDVI